MRNWAVPGTSILLLLILAGNSLSLLYKESPETEQINLKTYQELLSLRPTWAPYWAGLVQEKRARWQYDEEMQRAIQTTVKFGPWIGSVQRIVLIAGYDGWPFLEKPTQHAVQKTLLRALQQQPRTTIALAMDSGFLPQLLPIIQDNVGLHAIYKKELQRRKQQLNATRGKNSNG